MTTTIVTKILEKVLLKHKKSMNRINKIVSRTPVNNLPP